MKKKFIQALIIEQDLNRKKRVDGETECTMIKEIVAEKMRSVTCAVSTGTIVLNGGIITTSGSGLIVSSGGNINIGFDDSGESNDDVPVKNDRNSNKNSNNDDDDDDDGDDWFKSVKNGRNTSPRRRIINNEFNGNLNNLGDWINSLLPEWMRPDTTGNTGSPFNGSPGFPNFLINGNLFQNTGMINSGRMSTGNIYYN